MLNSLGRLYSMHARLGLQSTPPLSTLTATAVTYMNRQAYI